MESRDLNIAGVVLAGGLSSRMGQDKAQLAIQKQSLLSRAVNLLENTSIEDVFVSGDYPPYSCILDIYPEFGPLSGIHACVSSLSEKYDALFILPIDMPLLTLSECNELLKQFTTFQQGVFYQDATFPMILPLSLTLKCYLSEALNTKGKKQRSLYRLLNTCNVKALSYSEAQAFRFQNSNTPEQWQHCLEIYNKIQQDKDKV